MSFKSELASQLAGMRWLQSSNRDGSEAELWPGGFDESFAESLQAEIAERTSKYNNLNLDTFIKFLVLARPAMQVYKRDSLAPSLPANPHQAMLLIA